MAVVLRCPDCRKTFPWQAAKDMPRFCPLCGADMGENKADDAIVMPFIRSNSSISKVGDQVYRDMERGSEIRVQAAAEMTGSTVEDMSSLKITNMNDGGKQGDVAAISVGSNLANLGMKSLDDGFKGVNGAEFSAGVGSGPMPNAGAKMRTALQQAHSERTNGAGVSDRPALETMQPGYRRRG